MCPDVDYFQDLHLAVAHHWCPSLYPSWCWIHTKLLSHTDQMCTIDTHKCAHKFSARLACDFCLLIFKSCERKRTDLVKPSTIRSLINGVNHQFWLTCSIAFYSSNKSSVSHQSSRRKTILGHKHQWPDIHSLNSNASYFRATQRQHRGHQSSRWFSDMIEQDKNKQKKKWWLLAYRIKMKIGNASV